MKKLLLLILLLLITKKVYADEIIKEDIKDVTYHREINGKVQEYQTVKVTSNGYTLYCIEPGIPIISTIYNKSRFENTGYNIDIERRLQLLGHFGYLYEDNTSINYYLATQKLIWETLGIKNIYFKNKYGIINIEYEENKIKSLVQNYSHKAIYNNTKHLLLLGEEIEFNDTLEDTFKILNTNQKIISENPLRLKTITSGIDLIKIQKETRTRSLIYKSNGSQTFAFLKKPSEISISEVELTVLDGTIEVHTNNVDATYTLYKDNIIINTQKGNYIYFENLALGNYILKIDNVEDNYEIDKKDYEINLTKEEYNKKLNLDYKDKEYNIKITKIYIDEEKCIKEKDTKFNLYKEDSLVKELITDESGEINITLPKGVYNLVQKTNNYDYKIKDEVLLKIEKNEDIELIDEKQIIDIKLPNTKSKKEILLIGIILLYIIRKTYAK